MNSCQLLEAFWKDMIKRNVGGLRARWHILTVPGNQWWKKDESAEFSECCIIIRKRMFEERSLESHALEKLRCFNILNCFPFFSGFERK
jgi:hypothetical protein